MDKIATIIDQDNIDNYGDFLSFQIEGIKLDHILDHYYPGNMYVGLVPTLLFWMEQDKEREIVWTRIKPNIGMKTICPILMCPDDCDFSCTIIVAEIENTGKTIRWNKVGIDETNEFDAEMIGSKVKWFDRISPMEFYINEYDAVIEDFDSQFQIDKNKWEKEKKN